ncbi:MAG: sensor histidine kinase [Chitinophagaceae bacterium]|nr:sensor histidine kinase [Chitinophagaceae bacterium]
MKQIPPFVLLSLLFSIAIGQSTNKDSLISALPAAREDTSKIALLLNIERLYMDRTRTDSAFYYNQQAEKLISKLDARSFLHRCYHEYVKIYHAKAEYDSALLYCLKSIEVAKVAKNKFQEAGSYRAIFNIYHNLRLNDSAVKYSIHSINLTEEIGDTANITTNYGNLSWLYLDLKQYDKAIAYGQKGVESGERYADTIGLLIALNNLALNYFIIDSNTKAIGLWQRQLALARKVNRVRSVRRALINLATVYFETANAAATTRTAAELNVANDDDPNLDSKNKAYQFAVNGYSYFLRKEFAKAEEQFVAGMEIARADSVTDALSTIYMTLSHLKFAQHDFIAGLHYASESDELSLMDQETALSEYGLELEKKYETEKKDNQLKLQQATITQKNTLNYLLIGSIGALLIISLLSYRNYKNKQKFQRQRISELETEKQLTATEAVLKGEEQERSRLARDLHDGLGGMLSGIKYSFQTMKGNLIMTPDNQQAFERSMDMLDSSIREMRRVAHNMMPEALLKFGLDAALKDFCNDVNQSGALQIEYKSIGLETAVIDSTLSITVYRIIQELVNNTMKHAVAKTAIVQVAKNNNELSITVEDDGKGFDPAILRQSKGIGWSNIQNRVEFLKGKLDVQSGNAKGTSVLIELTV